MLDDEANSAILEARARALAAVRESTRVRTRELALFEREGIRYAIDPAYVCQVARVLAPTPLPLTPAHWRGLSSLHGELLGIIDLPRLLEEGNPRAGEDSEPTDEDEPRLVLVLGKERPELGLLIDKVLEGRALRDELVPLGTHESGKARGLLGGATADGVRLVVAETLFADPRLVLESATTDQPSNA